MRVLCGHQKAGYTQTLARLGIMEGECEAFTTEIFIEDDELSCSFMMRVEQAELTSLEVLLEAIAHAAFEATQMSFDFTQANVESIDELGTSTMVSDDAGCALLPDAAGVRVRTSRRGQMARGTRQAHRVAPACVVD